MKPFDTKNRDVATEIYRHQETLNHKISLAEKAEKSNQYNTAQSLFTEARELAIASNDGLEPIIMNEESDFVVANALDRKIELMGQYERLVQAIALGVISE